MHKISVRLFLPLLVGITFVSRLLSADTVNTSNGSSLNGTLKRITGGVVYLDTGFAGIVKVAQSDLKFIRTDNPIYFRLDSGSTILGVSNQAAREGWLAIQSRDGLVQAQLSTIQDAWRKDGEDPVVTKLKEQQALERRKWTYSAGVDLSGQKGNSNEFGLAANLEARLKGPVDLLRFYFSVQNTQQDGKQIADETKGGVDYSSDLDRHFGWYTRFELEKDKFEELDLRSVSAVGLSYRFFKTDRQKLSLRSGFAYRYESFSAKDNTEDPAIDFGMKYDLAFGELFEIESIVSYMPGYADFSNYRLAQDTGVEIQFQKNGSWKVRTGLSNYYNSQPVSGKEQLDTKYYTRLVFSWGKK